MDSTAHASASITLIPTEIILQIFSGCHEIPSQINLASTCQRLRHIWLENIVFCVSEITGLTASEIEDATIFARQEHDKQHAQAATILSFGQVHNEQVYRWLPSIMTMAKHCEVLRTRYLKSLAEFKAMGLSHQIHISDQYPGEDPSSICKPYLVVRRMVLGYHNFDLLRTVYADIHGSDDKDLDDIRVVSVLLKQEISCSERDIIGIPVNEPQWVWWDRDLGPEEYIYPLEWEFTFYIIWLAAGWRFDHPEHSSSWNYEQEAAKVDEAWDHDRVSAMWGSIERPWEKLSARWQSRDVNGREEWYKDGRHIPYWREGGSRCQF